MFSLNNLYLTIILSGFALSLSLPANAVVVNLSSTAEGGNSNFTGELLETSCARTGVVMFHGRGLSPTGPVTQELRTSLQRAGYTTLAIDNPIPLNNQTDFTSYVNDVGSDNYVFPEAYARMRTAINHLQSLGVEQVIVAGFSLGSRLAAAHVARGQIDELPVVGFIGVGMYGNSIEPLNVSTTLDEISVPVLDLYGDVDTAAADTAADRLSAYNTGTGMGYTQTALTCVGGTTNCHQLEGIRGSDTQPLETNVNAWMQAVAAATLVTGCVPTVTAPASGGDSGGAISVFSLFAMMLVLQLIRFQHINGVRLD